MKGKTFFICAVICAVLAGCGAEAHRGETAHEAVAETQKADTKPSDAVAVTTTTVEESDVVIPVRAAGTLSSKTEVKLSFKTSGIVEELRAEEGQTVRKGMLLARLDLAEIASRVEQARAGYDKAKRDLERVERLYEENVTPLEKLQDARTGFDIARSGMKVAEFNLQHSSIYAPASGRVLKRFAERGEIVASGSPVYLFALGTQDWVVRVGVSDADVLRLRPGDPAEIRFDPYGEDRFGGRVTEIGETASPANGLYEVEIRLEPSDLPLVSGFVGEADILPTARERYILVPIESLVEGDGMTGYVFVLDDGADRVRKRRITVAHILDARVAVSAGISPGDVVVVEGTDYLVDGSSVRVTAR